jgi:general secretion pathway protein D
MQFKLLFALLLTASFAAGQNTGDRPNPSDPNVAEPASTPGDDPLSSFQAVNASIDTVLQQYEQLTGRILIKDSNLSANALPITISVPQPVPKSELIRLIESALLLNNIVLIPSQEPNTVKVININTGKNPRSEGVKLFAGPESIPEGEQVISYYMPFKYISASEALTIFQTHILPRAYTSFVPINSSQALLVTESTSVIRQLVALKQMIDTPPQKSVTQFVPLIRADAERVAESINKLLDNQQKSSSNAQGQGAPNPNVQITSSTGGTDTYSSSLGQLIPDARTNRILVVSRAPNIDFIVGLIKDFDQAVGTAKPLEYKLRYVAAADVLSVIGDVLSEGEAQGGQTSGGQSQGQNRAPSQQRSTGYNPSSSGSSSGSSLGSSSSLGGSSIGGSSIGGSSSGGGSSSQETTLQEPQEVAAPQSVVVGKTRVVADPKNNQILAIGPPESLDRIRLILDRLDARPQQVYLATIIGQLTLGNDLLYGVDFLQTYKKINNNAGIATGNVNSAPQGTSLTPLSIANPSSLTNGNVFGSTSSALSSASGLTIYGSISDAVKVFVQAANAKTDFKILARPSVYTANNKLAVISSGQRVPYAGSSLSNITGSTTNIVGGINSTAAVQSTTEFIDVSLRLEVIPLINSNNEVTLKVVQINDSIAKNVTISGNTVPQINSQRLTTTVTVPSGATVVLGGLIQENVNQSDNGIPILDSLPYVGILFKTRGVSKSRAELLVFIQPSVVNNDVATIRQSLREERRTTVGGRTYDLAHPQDFSGAPSPSPYRKKKGTSKDY